MNPRGALLAHLQEENGGSIPFWRFMQEALYHPEFGYYTSQIRGIGRRGDFSTLPVLDDILGKAIARWISPDTRHVIEVGAGQGQLARAVRRSLGLFRRWRTVYHIVEISPVLRARQQALLGESVRWHNGIGSALEAANGVADVFSNELVDAFPCRVFEKSDPGWRELGLRLEGGTAVEILRDAVLPASSAFGSEYPTGSRVEVHESYRDWVKSWRPLWRRGRMLTIDYGSTMPGLYRRRPQGSLRAYSHHQHLTGREVYSSFGHRDITADVNFSDLIEWGNELRMDSPRLSPLDAFLAHQLGGNKVPKDFRAALQEFQVLEQTTARLDF